MRRLGSVEHHQGRWRVRVHVDGRRRVVGTFDTLEEAERLRAATERVIEAERASTVTVAEHAVAWLRDRETTHRDALDARKFRKHRVNR